MPAGAIPGQGGDMRAVVIRTRLAGPYCVMHHEQPGGASDAYNVVTLLSAGAATLQAHHLLKYLHHGRPLMFCCLRFPAVPRNSGAQPAGLAGL